MHSDLHSTSLQNNNGEVENEEAVWLANVVVAMPPKRATKRPSGRAHLWSTAANERQRDRATGFLIAGESVLQDHKARTVKHGTESILWRTGCYATGYPAHSAAKPHAPCDRL